MTLLHISENGSKLKMVASLIESLPGTHKIQGYTHGDFRPLNTDLETFFTELMGIGTTQHFAITPGNHISQLKQLAELENADFYYI